eukprot:1730329-Amphidinium_carterae.1
MQCEGTLLQSGQIQGMVELSAREKIKPNMSTILAQCENAVNHLMELKAGSCEHGGPLGSTPAV